MLGERISQTLTGVVEDDGIDLDGANSLTIFDKRPKR